mgnify:CR=1 FL=1
MMKIGFASDHAGVELKGRLCQWAENHGFEIVDFGTHTKDAVDYVDYAYQAIQRRSEWDRLVLVCGSGIGMSISANRLPDIRCALVTSPDHARLARQHNDANIISIPARYTSIQQAVEMVATFLNTDFEGGRHANRVNKIACK